MKRIVIALSIIVALLRPVFIFVAVNHHVAQSYQAVAHLLVGGLFATWWVSEDKNDWALQTALALTVVEVSCAAITVVLKVAT
jgi:dipeptide/tripeptide permease